jgi:putative peptidoglycan lipid II flippase
MHGALGRALGAAGDALLRLIAPLPWTCRLGILASFLATGSITYLFYGMRFIHFPLGIFGVAIATAVLPTLSTQAAKQEMDSFRDTLSLGLRLVFFIMFPAMAGLIMLRIPIVNLLLEHGEFNRVSTLGTASALL